MTRIVFITVIFLYIIYVIYMYKLIGNTFFSLPGYNYKTEIDTLEFIIVLGLALIPTFFFNLRSTLPSNFIMIILYLVHIIPSLIFFMFYFDINNISFGEWLWLVSISFYFLIFILFYQITSKFILNIHILKGTKFIFKNFYLKLTVISLILFFIFIYYFKGFKNISIFHVYEIRNSYIETTNRIIGYLTINVGYILSPYLVMQSFCLKSWAYKLSLFIIGISLSIVIFSNTGFKSVAFMWIYTTFWFFLLKKIGIKHLTLKTTMGFILLIWILHLIGVLSNMDFIYLHWIRRLILSSGIITTYFYDFITVNELTYLKNAPNIISLQYFGTDGSANTGLIGDGFTRYLYVGIIANYILLFCYLKVLDSIFVNLKNRNDQIILTALSFPIGYALSYSKTLSLLLTYGFILMIIIFYWRLIIEKQNLSHINSSSNI